MKYNSIELNKSFETKEQLIKAVFEAKDEIISIKKAQVYEAHKKGLGVCAKGIDYLKLETQVKSIVLDNDFHYIAVNTTKILDSHLDLHLNGIWDRTVKNQNGKNYLVLDHSLSVEKVVAKKEHVEMFTAELPFSMLGKNYEGSTEALIYKVRKDKVINKAAKEWLESGDDIQASVRMQYVDIEFAADTNEKGFEKAKAAYELYKNDIANKSEIEEIPYFWAVKQAKNVYESSLVLIGSNQTTGIIRPNIYDSISRKSETLESTQENEKVLKYLLDNFKLK